MSGASSDGKDFDPYDLSDGDHPAQQVCKHEGLFGAGPFPASWMCKCGTKVYRSYEDYCDD